MKTRTRNNEGFTLAEVMVALLLIAMLSAVLIQSVALSRRITYSNAQRVSAFGMCKGRLEGVRGMEYDQIVVTNFIAETGLQFLHLSGKDRLPIACSRSVTINSQTNPVRKDIQVLVSWNYRGTAFQEQINAVVYPKN